MTYTIGELFAGYGGLGLGVQATLGPARTAWVSDVCKFDKDGNAGHYDPHRGPCAILAHHYPDAPNLGDITAVDWTQVEPVDVITGGSPCQDVSHAGKRAGMKAGTRSGLWAAMTDAIDIIRPRLVVWENVRGVLSAEADSALEPCAGCVGDGDDGPVLRALGRVLGDLAGLGYVGGWCGLRAADVGACHGRFRVFVVAWPAADAHQLGRQWPGRARDGRPGPAHRDRGALTLLPTPAVNDMDAGKTPDAWDAWTERMKGAHGNGNGHGASLEIEALRLLPTARATDGTKGGPNQRGSSGDLMLPSAVMELLPTPSAADALGGHERRGGQRGDELLLNGMAKAGHLARFGKYAAAIARHESMAGRPAPEPTEPTGKGGAHRLSPRFVEWMQGLPDGWVTDHVGRNDALKALGNGVVPQQAAEAVRWVLSHAITGEAAA